MQSSIKRYNAEGHTQSVIECLLELRARHRVRSDDVARVEIEAFKQVHNIVGGGEAGDRAQAASKEQADHSLPYICAAALLDGDVWTRQFVDARIQRRDVQELMQRVWVRQREELSARYPMEMPCRVRIVLRDGSELTAEKSDYLGFARTRPFDWRLALEKFERLAGPELDGSLLREIPEAVDALDTIKVAELTELLGRAGGRRARASA
jgi:2-methylcitrate dehydratase